MSKADELHEKIMTVLHSSLEDGSVTYADIFGAIEITKAFFTFEYETRLYSIWKRKDEEMQIAKDNK